MSPDARIARIAAKQHGAFTKQQAQNAGHTAGTIRHRLAAGRWVALHPGVYALAGTAPTWERSVIAATLRFGAVASGTTAARLLRILESSDTPLHLTLPPGQNRANRRGLAFHEADLGRTDARTVRGIPCTGPERTLVDLAGQVTERALESAFDDAIQLGLTTIPKLYRYIDERRLWHNAGMERLRRLMEDRAHGAMHKELEKLFRRKLSAAGLPEPTRQFPVAGHPVDFVYPGRRIAIELDGLGGHFNAAASRRDKRRDNDIVLAGYRLFHFSWEDVHDTWPAVERTLRQSLDGEG